MVAVNYWWDVTSDNVLMEKSDDGGTAASYAQEPGLYGAIISQHQSGQRSYYHFDGHGSTRMITDKHEDIIELATYDAFGQYIEKAGGIANPYGFNGRLGWYSDTGTQEYYVRARHYSRSTGRWISLDPAGFVDGPGRYVFVTNDPINASDSSGLSTGKCTVLHFAVHSAGCGYRLWEGVLTYGNYFSTQAAFGPPCRCCEFRQYFTCDSRSRYTLNGKTSPWDVEMKYGELREDCSPDGRCYGHREDSHRRGAANTWRTVAFIVLKTCRASLGWTFSFLTRNSRRMSRSSTS